MGRAKRVFSDIYPYHITARCINREWFKVPIESVWEIFCRHLSFANYGYEAQIHSFVLMSNHFHLLLTTPLANIDKIMWYVMTETSREITSHCGRINQTYGGPYHSCLITNDHYYSHAYKYVYRNPVDAGITKYVEDYKFSTLSGVLGSTKILMPLTEDLQLFPDTERNLGWLNHDYLGNQRDFISSALRRKSFGFALDKKTKKPNRLEYCRS